MPFPFGASAASGDGVVQTLTSISKMVLHKLQQTSPSATDSPSPEQELAASYRALRKDADRIGETPKPVVVPPARPVVPPPPPPPPMVIAGVGAVQQAGLDRLRIPVTLRLHGVPQNFHLQVLLTADQNGPVAQVELLEREKS